MGEPLAAGDCLTQADLLENAAADAERRRLDQYLIIDADFHQLEANAWAEIIEYIDNDVVRHFLEAGGRAGFGGSGGSPWLPGTVSVGAIQDVAGRIAVQRSRNRELYGRGAEGEATLIAQNIDMMGTDYVLIFPTELLHFGTNPFVELEAHLARAHARWMTERLLPANERFLTLLYLPFNDPDACVALVEEFGDRPGVVGFMVTSVRNQPVYHKAYSRLYRALEERQLVLGFHTAFHFYERSFEQFNRFISVHSLGFPYYNMVQAINWVINGLPERFPALKVLFIEGGLAWIPFVMERLDHEYRMRSSEAPMLKRLPSEYLREMYYTSQPLDLALGGAMLRATLDMINADSQLLYASDWPHWDFDLPGRILDLPGLSDQTRRNILGANAARLFGLQPTPGSRLAQRYPSMTS
jgi:predicted TIM-barrel fold metal-dependent hydrolase